MVNTIGKDEVLAHANALIVSSGTVPCYFFFLFDGQLMHLQMCQPFISRFVYNIMCLNFRSLDYRHSNKLL